MARVLLFPRPMRVVPASCLDRFTPRDFAFIREILGPRGDERDWMTDRETLRALLEAPAVFEAVTADAYPLRISLDFYFFVLVGRSLTDAGITDLAVIDYVAATLARHGVAADDDSAPAPPDADFTYHIDFVEALEGLPGYDRFFLQVRCGNQFLVMTGLFPGFLEHRSTRRGAPDIRYYEGVARSAFRAAGDHPLAEEFRLSRLYPRLADCIPEARRALNRMAEDYLFLGR